MCNNTDTNTDSVQNSMSSKDAIDAEDASIYVQYKGITHNIPIRDTVTDIIHAIASATSTDPATIKLLPRTRRTPPITLSTLAPSIHPNDRFLLMASSIEAVRHVQNAQDLPGMAGFDHEARIIAQRTRTADDDAVVVLPRTPYTFQQFRTWAEPGLTLVPPESAALHMLHRLAADRGIQAVMTQYKWTVGLLAEMPPEGFVGISPVCVLGYNTNKGQEIHLRLRTDDMQGFRPYNRIRETLVHELAHNVHSDHDDAFKQLNSELLKQVVGASGGVGHTLTD